MEKILAKFMELESAINSGLHPGANVLKALSELKGTIHAAHAQEKAAKTATPPEPPLIAPATVASMRQPVIVPPELPAE